MAHQVLEDMKTRQVFASIDIHNNSGKNPRYSCVNRLDQRFFYLATRFSKKVVYFTKPEGVLSSAFAEFCPAITVECGLKGNSRVTQTLVSFLASCLNLDQIPDAPTSEHEMTLYHTVATIKVPGHVRLSFSPHEMGDMRFLSNLDDFNFHELPPQFLLGWSPTKKGHRLLATDERENEVGDRYFSYQNDEIRTKIGFMPSMLTRESTIIHQDCFGYIMEPMKHL